MKPGMTREEAWQHFARLHSYPSHEHGPTEAQPRLSTRNYFRECFEAGWNMLIERQAADILVLADVVEEHQEKIEGHG